MGANGETAVEQQGTCRDDTSADPASPTVMERPSDLVSSRRSTPSGLEPNAVLKSFLSARADEGEPRAAIDDANRGRDPEREAGMRRVRQLRIYMA